MARPQVSGTAEREMAKAEAQIQNFQDQLTELTQDRIIQTAPPATSVAQDRRNFEGQKKSKDIYLRPAKNLGVGVNPKTGEREKFNEKFRDNWNFDNENVHFIAENKEAPGWPIEKWTKPYPGIDMLFWIIPVNVPLWGPRYLAEQLKGCVYHVLKTQDNREIGHNGIGVETGGASSMIIDCTVQRLDATPVTDRKSIFMGASK